MGGPQKDIIRRNLKSNRSNNDDTDSPDSNAIIYMFYGSYPFWYFVFEYK